MALTVAASFAAALLVVLAFARFGFPLDDGIADSFFRLRQAIFGSRPVDPSIAIIGIADADEEALGLEAGGREPFARIVKALSAAGAAQIIIDAVFPDRGGVDGDESFARESAKAGNVFVPLVLRPVAPGQDPDRAPSSGGRAPESGAVASIWPGTVPVVVTRPGVPIRAGKAIGNYRALDRAAAGIGHINSQPDKDGVFRRIPLVIELDGKPVPSLALAAACAALRPERVELAFGSRIRLIGANAADGGTADFDIPIDRRGMALVDLPGPWAESFPYFPARALTASLEDPEVAEEAKEALFGARAIVADLSTASSDYGPTAYDAVYPLAGLHAAILDAMLSRRAARPAGPALGAAWALVSAALVAAFAMARPSRFLPLSALGLFAVAAAQFAAFASASIFPALAWPAIGTAISALAVNAGRYVNAEREKARVRSRMERYFAPEVITRILKSSEGSMVAERKTVTILFSDIAGFTSWCSSRDPAEIHGTLNAYFEAMTEIVFKHGGTVDKFIGDGLMAFFGDPVEQADHPLRAVAAAVEMQSVLRKAREAREGGAGLSMRVRIGVNTGEAVVGDLGSRRIMAYTAIGSSVNVASRLESKAPVDGVLVSESTYRAVEGSVDARYAGKTSAKGIPGEFDAWEIVAVKPH